MGTIRTSLVLQDGMSAVLRRISQSMNQVLGGFQQFQQAASQGAGGDALAQACREADRMQDAINEMDESYRACVEHQNQLNLGMSDGVGLANDFSRSMQKTARRVKAVARWIGDSFELYDARAGTEIQLQMVLAHAGASEGALDSLTAKAEALEKKTSFSSNALLGGAAELATYLSDDQAIGVLMETLTDYAAGMSRGGQVDEAQMVDYATSLGKMMVGSYDAMTEKGFQVTEAQKKIIENGSDMEKALTINEIISESWGQLAQAMAQTPQGMIQQTKNQLSSMRAELAEQLYPAVLRLFRIFQEHSDQIREALMGTAPLLKVVIEAATILAKVAAFMVDHWRVVGPLIGGVLAAVLAYKVAVKGVLGLYKTVKTVSRALHIVQGVTTGGWGAMAASTATATTAQGAFNAALWACPLTWFIGAILLLVALLYMVVGVINQVTGSSISATGILMGLVSTFAAFLWNYCMYMGEMILTLINHVVSAINAVAGFLKNVFADPVASVIHLFGTMADHILMILQHIGAAMDFLFGSGLADKFQGWRDAVSQGIDALAERLGNGSYQEVEILEELSMAKFGLERMSYTEAFQSAYDSWQGGSMDSLLDDNQAWQQIRDELGAIGGDVSDIAERSEVDTGMLQELRNLAEREAINRFTTAEIRIDMSGMTNRIDSTMDLDGVVGRLADELTNALSFAAEGVHHDGL